MFRASTSPVRSSIRSASVDLPWSMCAMMQKLRMDRGLSRAQASLHRRGPGRRDLSSHARVDAPGIHPGLRRRRRQARPEQADQARPQQAVTVLT